VTTSSDGHIQHWHLNSGKCLHHIKEDNDNNLYTLDFTNDGKYFAVAGSDTKVYVYDESTR
jgi:COMPASS component SWD3